MAPGTAYFRQRYERRKRAVPRRYPGLRAVPKSKLSAKEAKGYFGGETQGWMFLVAEALTFRRVKQHCLDRGKQPPRNPYRCQFECVLYHARPEEKKRRAMRNSHRARLGLKVGDPRHVHHMERRTLDIRKAVVLTPCEHRKSHGLKCHAEDRAVPRGAKKFKRPKRASALGNAILYTAGFLAVLLPTLFISDGTTIDSMALGILLGSLICLYFATGQYRGNDAPTNALVVHENPRTVEEVRQQTNARFLEGAQSALGGAVLGAVVALVVSLARFFEVRSENRFGDTMYIITGVGLGVYLITYYGATLKRRDAARAALAMDVEQFEHSVSEFLKAPERLKRVSLRAKEARDPIKQKIDALQGAVMGYMAERGIGELEYGENVLLLKESRRANTLNEKSLLEALLKYFSGDGQRAEACLEFVLEEIGTRAVSVLSRRKVKKARAAGRLEATQQAAMANSLANSWGTTGGWQNSADFWLTISMYLRSMAIFMIPMFALLGVVSWLLKRNVVITFVCFMLAFFFLFFVLIYTFTTNRNYQQTRKPFVYAMITSLISAGVLTFITRMVFKRGENAIFVMGVSGLLLSVIMFVDSYGKPDFDEPEPKSYRQLYLEEKRKQENQAFLIEARLKRLEQMEPVLRKKRPDEHELPKPVETNVIRGLLDRMGSFIGSVSGYAVVAFIFSLVIWCFIVFDHFIGNRLTETGPTAQTRSLFDGERGNEFTRVDATNLTVERNHHGPGLACMLSGQCCTDTVTGHAAAATKKPFVTEVLQTGEMNVLKHRKVGVPHTLSVSAAIALNSCYDLSEGQARRFFCERGIRCAKWFQWGLLMSGKAHIDPEEVPEMMTRLAFLKNRASFQNFFDSPFVDLSDDHLMRLLCVLVARNSESDGCPCLVAMLASPRVDFKRFTERYGEDNMEAFSDLRKRWCDARVNRWLLCGFMLPDIYREFDGKNGTVTAMFYGPGGSGYKQAEAQFKARVEGEIRLCVPRRGGLTTPRIREFPDGYSECFFPDGSRFGFPGVSRGCARPSGAQGEGAAPPPRPSRYSRSSREDIPAEASSAPLWVARPVSFC
ncbi:Uncharacterized protein SCF082_LOCUS32788 [Durusdinium trenchii]|uniref:Uncharacterized protein n=1 Tax=Durusdinium trenchii TaxID=1381693 RepID=A0ABP0NHI7_9DINO